MKWIEENPTATDIWKRKYGGDYKKVILFMVEKVFSALPPDKKTELKHRLGFDPEERMIELFLDARGLPGGRILYYFSSLAQGENRRLTPMNCFVIPIEDDSIEAIMDYAKHMAITFKAGGGVGTNLSGLRPEGATVNNAAMFSTGPQSFIKIYGVVGEEIGQKNRRGAQMKAISIYHPDSLVIIQSKIDGGLTSMNISMMVDDGFMQKDMDDEIEFWYPDKIETTPSEYKEVDYIANCYNHPDEFFKVKSETGFRQRVVYRTSTKRRVWNAIAECAWKCGDPGLLFWDTIRRDWKQEEELYSTNPCLSGDTKIAVADGRGEVSIKELADAGKDVNVFCTNGNDIVIRKMRNPRITGYNKDVYRVHFTSGNYIDATDNHKFLTPDDIAIETKNLKPGDSIKVCSRVATPNPVKLYNLWYLKTKYWKEHSLIADCPKGKIIHHKDGDTLNNAPDNLEILSPGGHNFYHKSRTMGMSNPRAIQISNDELLLYGIELAKELGRRFSKKEWIAFAKEHGLPVLIKGFRGNLKDFQKASVEGAGLEYSTIDPRMLRTIENMKSMGYETKIDMGRVKVKKVCEHCKNDFWAYHNRREVSFCSYSCGAYKDSKKRTEGMIKARQKEMDIYTEKQMKIYQNLKFSLGHVPMKKEWEKQCKENKIPFRLGKHSRFPDWKSFKAVAEEYNHRVSKVEYIGKQDVYNGTVDDFHNILVGGFKTKSRNGYDKTTFVNTLQCGEEPLPAWGACNLGSLNFSKYTNDNLEEFEKDTKAFFIFLDTLISYCIEKSAYPLIQQQESAKKFRQIGLGITGLADLFILKGVKYGDDKSKEILEARMRTKRKAEIETSEMLNEIFEGNSGPRNSQMSTVAPTGSTSMVLGCSGGIEPNFSYSYQKLVNGEYVDIYIPIVKTAPAKDVLISSHEVPWKDRIEIQAIAQRYTDGSISSTINLPGSAKVEEISEIYNTAWKAGLKGVTIYRDGSKGDGALKLTKPHKERGILEGKTVKVPLDSSWYITVNFNENLPVEVFINAGKSGSDTKAWTEALGRLSSLYLQSGGQAGKLISALQDIKGNKTIFKNGWSIQSGPDAIAQALSTILDQSQTLACPECGEATFLMVEGCGVCKSCGFEKC